MAKKVVKAKSKPKAKPVAKKKPAAKKTGKKAGLTQLTYNLSPELQAIIGSKTSTRPQIVKKLWVYIKARKLQDAKNKRLIVPDAKLAEVFGSKKPVDMMKMSGLLNKHIKK